MSQIFQNTYDKKHFFDFLHKFCLNDNNKFVFNKSALKKAKLENAIIPFCDELKKFYFPSKHFYLERDPIYKNIATIIRQICKYLMVPYTTQIKYSKSKYEIIYIIYQEKE